MVKLSDLPTAAEVREQDMRDLDYRREYERTKLSNDVAIKVLRYRTEHGLSQRDLARMIGMQQPHVARLESGDHEPSLSTLARLSSALGLDFSVDIKPTGLKLRYAARERKRALRLSRRARTLAAGGTLCSDREQNRKLGPCNRSRDNWRSGSPGSPPPGR